MRRNRNNVPAVGMLPLLPDTDDMKFTVCEYLGGGVLRVEVKIKGVLFKRLNEIYRKNATICWMDLTHHLGGGQMLYDEPAEQLEAIFQAYLLQMKVDLQEYFKPKQIESNV